MNLQPFKTAVVTAHGAKVTAWNNLYRGYSVEKELAYYSACDAFEREVRKLVRAYKQMKEQRAA